jgi:hypothetical protein
LSEATTAAVENARFIIPLPTGSYAGFKVSAINADGTVLSSYTTYKTYTLALGDIALYDLKTTGTNYQAISPSATTTASKASSPWSFGDNKDWIISNSSSKTYNVASTNYIKFSRNVDFTLSVPSGKAVTKITFVGYSNDSSTDSYISNIGSTTFESTDIVFPKGKSAETTATHTIVFAEALTGDIVFKLGGAESCLYFYLTYTDVAE